MIDLFSLQTADTFGGFTDTQRRNLTRRSAFNRLCRKQPAASFQSSHLISSWRASRAAVAPRQTHTEGEWDGSQEGCNVGWQKCEIRGLCPGHSWKPPLGDSQAAGGEMNKEGRRTDTITAEQRWSSRTQRAAGTELRRHPGHSSVLEVVLLLLQDEKKWKRSGDIYCKRSSFK